MKVKKARTRSLPAGFVVCPGCDAGVQPISMPVPAWFPAVRICPVCRAEIPESVPTTRKKPQPFEGKHQERYFAWVDAAIALGYEPFEAIYHVPNGGARNQREGATLKRQGVRAGVLDINVDVPAVAWHGLRIELKATREELGKKPEVSAEQRAWMERHTRNGYLAVVREGAEAAWVTTVDYLQLTHDARLRLIPSQTRP